MTTPEIAILVNAKTGQEFNLQRYSVSVGREIGNDVVLATDKAISRQHAVVLCIDEHFFVEDMASKNGTWLNGALVGHRAKLQSGDEIRMGMTRLLFLLIPSKLYQQVETVKSSRTQTFVDSVIPMARMI
ncbi:MAG: FHA domain-containing protein [Candidatus Obscuribacterales bacterium]|nr:FHA domain-containing protein [Candidatus Obscuribacterales bacterium]